MPEIRTAAAGPKRYSGEDMSVGGGPLRETTTPQLQRASVSSLKISTSRPHDGQMMFSFVRPRDGPSRGHLCIGSPSARNQGHGALCHSCPLCHLLMIAHSKALINLRAPDSGDGDRYHRYHNNYFWTLLSACGRWRSCNPDTTVRPIRRIRRIHKMLS